MANEDHLKILMQSVEAWNHWRRTNPEIEPDLSGADLSNADLTYANLGVASLEKANLTNCNFSQADLSWANLSQADLSKASLINVNLNSATLSDAKLSGASILWANFSYADLNNAIFREANLGNTVFGDTNLTGAIGLDSCRFIEPNIIDHQTVIRSGRLPLEFLRGCGLPDPLIEYLPILLSDPIQFYSCFISYSSKDQKFAEKLYTDLQNKGVRCWFAPQDLKIGDRIRLRVDESIRLHDKLLLVLSEQSLLSPWVEQEVETALEREREQKRTLLFPIRLDDAVMHVKSGWPSFIKRTRHIGDFSGWNDHDAYVKGINRLLNDLKTED
jgi:uncharacterized protein YjbI with pentapeptide repeats